MSPISTPRKISESADGTSMISRPNVAQRQGTSKVVQVISSSEERTSAQVEMRAQALKDE